MEILFVFQGYFFDAEASLSAAESDELVPENSTLSADLDPPFRKIPTTCVIVLQLLLVVNVYHDFGP